MRFSVVEKTTLLIKFVYNVNTAEFVTRLGASSLYMRCIDHFIFTDQMSMETENAWEAI